MKSKKLRRSPWSNCAETSGQKVENVSKGLNDPRSAVGSIIVKLQEAWNHQDSF